MNKKAIRTIATISVATVGVIHIINRINFSMNTVKELTSQMNTHDFEWRFGKIHYIKKGTGAPILLIHSLDCGSSSYEFKALIDLLSENNEVYAIDLLGYGLSEKANITYTNYLYVQLITDFIKTVIGRKTNIITSGNSSSIAIMACHNDNDIINQLLFINPQSLYQANLIPTKQTKLLKLFIDTPIIGTLVYNIQTNRKAIQKKFEEEYFYDPSKINDADIMAYIEAAHSNDYKVKYSFSSNIGRYMNINILHALKEINNSIVILSGSDVKDHETIVENYKYYNSAIETLNVDDTRLLPHLENTHETFQIINSVLM